MAEPMNPSPLVRALPRRLKLPFAWVEHIPFAFFLVETLRPRLVVELGTHSGNSYNAICQAVELAGLSTQCFAVDTWEGDVHAGSYDSSIYDELAAYQSSTYAKFSSLLRMTFDDALGRFADGSIDLLHIDGLHTYEAVKHDFETWLPKVAPGGVILMHDIAVREHDFGVWQLWDEIKKSFRTAEFSHGYGLGIVFVPGPVNEKITELHHALTQENSKLLFSSLGRTVLLEGELAELQSSQNALLHQHDLIRQAAVQLQQETTLLRKTINLLGFPPNIVAQVSCDTGEGFKEELTHRYQVTHNEVEFSYQLEAKGTELQGLFFSPINCSARLSNPTVVALDSQGNEFYLQSNCAEGINRGTDDCLEACGELPRLFFTNGLPKNIKEIRVKYQLLFVGSTLIDHMNTANDSLQSELSNAQHSICELKSELAQLRATNGAIEDSLSWRFTAPFRRASSWLKSNTPLTIRSVVRPRGTTGS